MDEQSDKSIAFKVPMTDPTHRTSAAIVAAFNQRLGEDSGLSADYRVYFDSSGVTAHAIQLRYFIPGKTWPAAARALYYQASAEFFRSRYDALQRFMTNDRELSTFWSKNRHLLFQI